MMSSQQKIYKGIFVTPSQIKSFVKFVATELGLQEWDIKLTIVPPEDSRLTFEAGEPGNDAITIWDENTRSAVIYVEQETDTNHVFGIRFTIVHELLHLLVEPLLHEYNGSTEYLINRLVRILFSKQQSIVRPPTWEVLDERI